MIGATLLLLFQSPALDRPSPPRGEILYYRETSRGHGDLFVLDLATREERQVGRSGTRSDHLPGWSADGRRFVFESYRRGGWHVWVANADGQDARRLSDLGGGTGNYEFDPTFAPDGRTVLYSRKGDLWTVTLEEPTPQRLAAMPDGLSVVAPAVSPDGSRVAVVGYDDHGGIDLYTLTRDGTALARRTRDQGRNLAPRWHPDGQSLLFYSDRDGSLELYEARGDGSEARPILGAEQRKAAGFEPTAFIDPFDNDYGANEQYRADYSPDGDWIVFSRDVAGDRELFLVRRDGTGLLRLTNRPGLDGQPAWRPRPTVADR